MKSVNQLRSYFYHTLLFLLLAIGLLGCDDPLAIPTIPPTVPPTPAVIETPPILLMLPTPPDAPLEQDPLSIDFSNYPFIAGSAEAIEPPTMTTPQDAALAVVRIRGCDAAGNCLDTNQGSGAIIHPQGIILTAWHVTVLDAKNRLSPKYYDHFLIEITDDISQPPQHRYAAYLIAHNIRDDLALLRIESEFGQPPEGWVPTEADLPWLPISNDERPANPELWVMGYPPTITTVDYRSYRYSGLEGSQIRIPQPLTKGFSGGPTVVQRENDAGLLGYEIVGVVSSRVQDVGLIRSVQQLDNLIWQPQEQMWAENAQIVATVVGGQLQSQLEVTVHTLGYRADEFDHQADLLLISDNQENKAQQRLQATNFVTIQELRIPLAQNSQWFNQPLFVSLFRLAEGEVWRVTDWIQPPAFQSQATSTPTAVATPIPIATSPPAIPAPTLTAVARATRIAIGVAEARAAQPTATPTHTPNLDQTATAEAQEIALAIAATLTAEAPTETSVPPTATDTLVLPTATPTSTFTPIPPTSTFTPLPTATLTPTPIPPTATSVPPTATFTLISPTLTYTPLPTATPPPTATPEPPPTATFTPIPPTPTLGIGSTYVNPVDGATYVYVPAGEFIMGSSDEQVDYGYELCTTYYGECQRSWYEDEQPQHTVYLDSYWIMKTEVTNAQYRKFMDAGGYTTEGYWSPDGWAWRTENNVTEPDEDWNKDPVNSPTQPIIDVSWYESEAYAKWLSAETGLGFGLPTEAQWEKAARGSDGRYFPWGNQWDGNHVNYCDSNCTQDWADKETNDGYQYSAPVGSYPTGVSPYGALDMAGNVWEWTADGYAGDYYKSSPDRNPQGPASADRRVLRGGSWFNDPVDLRAASRYRNYSNDRYGGVGFRLRLSSSPD